jgi:hypothetical protein
MPGSTIERPVSALRQRMLEDMAIRGLRSDTQRDYIRFVRSFAAFLGRSPDKHQAQQHLIPQAVAVTFESITCRAIVSVKMGHVRSALCAVIGRGRRLQTT